MRALFVLVVLSWALMGCSGNGRPQLDAGPPTDAGPLPDTGVPNDTGPAQDAWVPPSPLVDPMCTDGQYTESLPDDSVNIQDLIAAYTSANVHTFVDQVLMRRYPLGRQLVMEGLVDRDCIMMFLSDTSTADAVLGDIGTVVHECGHLADFRRSAPPINAYVVNPMLVLMASGGDATNRGGVTFARSLIRADAYQPLRMPCGMNFTPSCDQYADVYLDGSPTDMVFQGGDQGFNTVLEESTQYVNSLATAYAFRDIQAMTGFSVSARDGILTFLWYIERYLHMARTSYPMAYDLLLNGSMGQWRHAILTNWGRAWLFLQATAGMSDLGIGDTMIMPLVTDPVLLDEIQRLRAVECP